MAGLDPAISRAAPDPRVKPGDDEKKVAIDQKWMARP
jgi:hypothetical protein